ncbi:MAG: DUF1549 domain-containing protein [Pirellulaceae bacterium]
MINKQVRQTWKEYEITPSAPATDGEWVRRLYLDILGRIPTVAELNTFLGEKDPDKRTKLVARLLYDESYTEEYARNWTTIWTNVLIGRSGGTERNSLTNRAGLQKYLRDSFARNKYYDKMVHELVTATGHNSPGAEDFNGAVNFLTMKLDEKASRATAETAKIFLGLQVQCTQCHNHPFNEWKQQKFWEMNAFFRQTRALRRFVPGTRTVSGAELIDQDFAGEGGTSEALEADIFYELRNGLTKVAYPVFVDGTSIGRSGYVEDVIRRKELGKLILSSEYLEKTIVNRMWAHFMGHGFTKPIDDMGPHNPSTHPLLLDYLAGQVRKKNFDLKPLIGWIALSQPYALSSRTNATNAKVDDPLMGETPKFSHFYLRQMRAEELYESLVIATEAQKTRGSYSEQEKAKGDWLRQFIVAFGTDDGEETTTFNGTIPQALMMFNGDLIKRATSKDNGSFLSSVAKDKTRSAQKINLLFLTALARKPTKKELTVANQLLLARKGDVTGALQDIWWAVLNSNEFILNH